jgi:hypothetical protein
MIVGVVIGGVVLSAICLLLYFLVIRKKESDKVGNSADGVKGDGMKRGDEIEADGEPKREDESKAGEANEVDDGEHAHSGHDDSPAVESDSGSSHEVASDHAEKSDEAAGGDDQVAEPAAGKAPRSRKPRKHSAKGDGDDVPVIEQEAVEVICAPGGRVTRRLPLTEVLWARRAYEATFDPQRPELWLSSDKGWCEPGATEFPFELFYQPTDDEEIETTLIVSFGTFKTVTTITAKGEKKKLRRHHRG